MDPLLSGVSSGTGERPSPTKRELQLQGPRPAPLRVNKESYKIKKPPVAPPHHHPQPPPPAAPAAAAAATTQNQPVIIYSVSPKVIHTTVSDFMGVVQRLTGSSTSQAQTSASTSGSGELSPAARLASIEKTSPSERERDRHREAGPTEQIEVSAIIENSTVEMGQIPGILSPAPASLLPISPPGLFSPASDPWMLMQLNNMFPSPSALFSAPLVSPSPSSSHDLFPFFDF